MGAVKGTEIRQIRVIADEYRKEFTFHCLGKKGAGQLEGEKPATSLSGTHSIKAERKPATTDFMLRRGQETQSKVGTITVGLMGDCVSVLGLRTHFSGYFREYWKPRIRKRHHPPRT